MKTFFKRFLSSAKTTDNQMKRITAEWHGKHIELDVKNKTLFYRNVVSPRDAGECYPSGFFDVHSVNLNDIDVEACIKQAKRCLEELSFEREYPFLGLPGASLDCFMSCVDVYDNCLYYTNTHRDNFTVKRETEHEEFVRFFELLKSHCDFQPICSNLEGVFNHHSNAESRYLEETLWMCKKCGAGNLLENRCCVKCGEDRGW